MLKIRGISNAENLLMGVNRFGHCLTSLSKNLFLNHFNFRLGPGSTYFQSYERTIGAFAKKSGNLIPL